MLKTNIGLWVTQAKRDRVKQMPLIRSVTQHSRVQLCPHPWAEFISGQPTTLGAATTNIHRGRLLVMLLA